MQEIESGCKYPVCDNSPVKLNFCAERACAKEHATGNYLKKEWEKVKDDAEQGRLSKPKK